MKNKDLRIKMIEKEVSSNQVAKEYGMTPSSFYRLLKNELSDKRKQKIFEAIDSAAAKNIQMNN